jgi:hypothetical protein
MFRCALKSVRGLAFAGFAAAAVLFSGAAGAQTYGYDNLTVDVVGVVSWGQYGAFVGFVGGIPYGGTGQVPYSCINGIAYFDQTQNNSKYWYMNMLTAKASGLRLYVELTQDGYHNCFVVGSRVKT